MTRFAIDAATALRIVADGVQPHPDHSLVSPVLMKSQVLDRLYRQVRAGELDQATARRLLDGVTTMRVRLLGDRVSRRTAWRIAEEHGCEGTDEAEYLAVTRLQADSLIALDPRVVALADGVVPLAPLEALTRP
jgi:predicted nucleic acid-binding protein